MLPCNILDEREKRQRIVVEMWEGLPEKKTKKMDTMIGARALRRTLYIVSSDVIVIRL